MQTALKNKIDNLFNEFYFYVQGQEDFKIQQNEQLKQKFIVLSQKNESKEILIKENKKMIVYGYKATLRSDGRYVVKPNLNGKQICIYGKDKEELQIKMKLRLLKEERKISLKKNGSFLEWYNKWIEIYKKPNLRESTFKKLTSEFKNHSSALFKYNIEDLSSAVLQEHLNNIITPRTRERIKIYIKDCLNKAYLNNIIDYNPMNAVEIKKHKKEHYKAMNKEQEELFVKTLLADKYNNHLPILICLYQGLRIGEAIALNYDDFDFVNNTITINKSRKYKTVQLTKTDKSNRIIPLFNKTKEFLINIESGKDIFKKGYNALTKTLNRIKAKEPSLKEFVFHSLRHTFTTRCIENGVHFKTVAKWLGHSSTSMTMEVYTHINKDFEEKQIEIMNNKKE